jgi:sulfofructose kinase
MDRIPKLTIGGAGVCCVDHVFTAPRVPWGRTGRVRRYSCRCGGLVGTALAACKRLGAQTHLASLLGQDSTGAQIVSELADFGMEASEVVQSPSGRSPVSFIHLDADNGERTIFHYAAQGLKWSGRIPEWLKHCSALLVDEYYPDLGMGAARAARQCGVPVIADTWPKPANGEFMQDVDVLISPRHFLSEGGFGEDYEAALSAIHRTGPRLAVITLGAEGWVASDAAGRYRGTSFEIEAMDTVGAGDVFHGAFAFGIGSQWPTPQCAEFASAVAALKCANSEGWRGIPDLATTLDYLKKNGSPAWSVSTAV